VRRIERDRRARRVVAVARRRALARAVRAGRERHVTRYRDAAARGGGATDRMCVNSTDDVFDARASTSRTNSFSNTYVWRRSQRAVCAVLQYGRCDLISADGSRDRRRARDTATRDARPDVDGATRRDANARRRATGDDGRRRAATRAADGERERGDAARATAADARGRGRRVTHRERVADAKGRRAAVERED
jgi:hypothetical protein